MTITVNRRQRKQPKYYVYFDDWTGEIISVGNSLRTDCLAPYIETTDMNAAAILNGELSDNQFIVRSDKFNVQRLIRKNEFLQLRQQEDCLFLLPNHRLSEWDVRAKLYLRNHKLVFEINRDKLKKFVAHTVQREIKLAGKADFEFYMIKRDCPDYLLETFQIDVQSLIRYGSVVIDVGYFLSTVKLDNINILTRRYFENYYFELVNDVYVEADQPKHHRPDNYWNTAATEGNGHIAFTQRGNVVTVRSLVGSEQLDNLGIHEAKMPFFVVTDSPDHYIDTFEVDISSIRIGQSINVQVDYDLDFVQFIHGNPDLKVIKRKEL